jgi:hypothetical protein
MWCLRRDCTTYVTHRITTNVLFYEKILCKLSNALWTENDDVGWICFWILLTDLQLR